jgi:FtsH-binding integral membrane protein
MDHWQRVFAYTTGALVIGLLLIVFTNSFLVYVSEPGSTGYLVLLAYGFVFLNLGYGVNRRFALKSDRIPALHYTLALLMVAPTLVWIYTKDTGLGSQQFVFTATIIFAVMLGTYYGIKKGSARRNAYLRQIYKDREREMPEDLKRPHDDLNKN